MDNKNLLTKTQFVVLAGGKGTRMGVDIPKVLMPFGGTTMIQYLIDNAIRPLSPSLKPIVVVGFESEKVISTLGDVCSYVLQAEQLGTGHAVMEALPSVESSVEQIVVLYGDMPLLKPDTLINLAKVQSQTTSPLTMLTIKVPDYQDWRQGFYNWGRIIRNDDNEIEEVIEVKDATEEQKLITEVTSAHFAIDRAWATLALSMIDNNNNSGEYYLTKLPEIATSQGWVVQSVAGNPREVVGANTLSEFALLKSILENYAD